MYIPILNALNAIFWIHSHARLCVQWDLFEINFSPEKNYWLDKEKWEAVRVVCAYAPGPRADFPLFSKNARLAHPFEAGPNTVAATDYPRF